MSQWKLRSFLLLLLMYGLVIQDHVSAEMQTSVLASHLQVPLAPAPSKSDELYLVGILDAAENPLPAEYYNNPDAEVRTFNIGGKKYECNFPSSLPFGSLSSSMSSSLPSSSVALATELNNARSEQELVQIDAAVEDAQSAINEFVRVGPSLKELVNATVRYERLANDPNRTPDVYDDVLHSTSRLLDWLPKDTKPDAVTLEPTIQFPDQHLSVKRARESLHEHFKGGKAITAHGEAGFSVTVAPGRSVLIQKDKVHSFSAGFATSNIKENPKDSQSIPEAVGVVFATPLRVQPHEPVPYREFFVNKDSKSKSLYVQVEYVCPEDLPLLDTSLIPTRNRAASSGPLSFNASLIAERFVSSISRQALKHSPSSAFDHSLRRLLQASSKYQRLFVDRIFGAMTNLTSASALPDVSSSKAALELYKAGKLTESDWVRMPLNVQEGLAKKAHEGLYRHMSQLLEKWKANREADFREAESKLTMTPDVEQVWFDGEPAPELRDLLAQQLAMTLKAVALEVPQGPLAQLTHAIHQLANLTSELSMEEEMERYHIMNRQFVGTASPVEPGTPNELDKTTTYVARRRIKNELQRRMNIPIRNVPYKDWDRYETEVRRALSMPGNRGSPYFYGYPSTARSSTAKDKTKPTVKSNPWFFGRGHDEVRARSNWIWQVLEVGEGKYIIVFASNAVCRRVEPLMLPQVHVGQNRYGNETLVAKVTEGKDGTLSLEVQGRKTLDAVAAEHYFKTDEYRSLPEVVYNYFRDMFSASEHFDKLLWTAYGFKQRRDRLRAVAVKSYYSGPSPHDPVTEHDILYVARLLNARQRKLKCSLYKSGWWGYAFCPGYYIEQFHGSLVSYPESLQPFSSDTMSYILGLYPFSLHGRHYLQRATDAARLKMEGGEQFAPANLAGDVHRAIEWLRTTDFHKQVAPFVTTPDTASADALMQSMTFRHPERGGDQQDVSIEVRPTLKQDPTIGYIEEVLLRQPWVKALRFVKADNPANSYVAQHFVGGSFCIPEGDLKVIGKNDMPRAPRAVFNTTDARINATAFEAQLSNTYYRREVVVKYVCETERLPPIDAKFEDEDAVYSILSELRSKTTFPVELQNLFDTLAARRTGKFEHFNPPRELWKFLERLNANTFQPALQQFTDEGDILRFFPDDPEGRDLKDLKFTVEEVSHCMYEVVVSLPELCRLPMFQPRPKQVSEIVCIEAAPSQRPASPSPHLEHSRLHDVLRPQMLLSSSETLSNMRSPPMKPLHPKAIRRLDRTLRAFGV